MGRLLQGDALGGGNGEHVAHCTDDLAGHAAVGAGQEAGEEGHGAVGPPHLVGGGVDKGLGRRLPDGAVGRGAGQWGLLGGIEAVPLHQHPVILPLNGHVGDGAVGGPVVHVAVAGAVQGQMAEEASSVAGGHGYAVLDSLAQTLHRGQGGAAVHLDPLPPDGVGADGLVEEQRVGAQTAQVKGLPLLLNEFGQAGGQVRQHPLAKRQVRVVIGHGMDQRLLAQRGDIALLTIL